ncbi:phosphodiester glycosidase family protein [Clostridium sp. YIM B02505]|uniref:Phosphodiester glycosidase family protein n=1 Tax=Clostridium yunnanense TaxID=2800325 RepID=A0ABS1EJY7_9CLOT|nr:phosphodiester glycosidase family protein [Clostridium yunnanense]MBK1809672.1 phosphodiester glycosidase family protein [Clostridium yunnanense]
MFRKKFRTILINLAIFIGCNLLIGLIYSLPMTYYGPFDNLKEMVVTSAMTTYRHQYLATWFLDKDQINEIMNKNKIDTTDNSDIKDISVAVSASASTEVNSSINTDIPVNKTEGVEFVNIDESRYKGYLLIVKDPKRIELGVTKDLTKFGIKLDDMCKENNAIGGINAGGFEDENGQGNGGTPTGIVVKDGEILYKTKNDSYSIVGFNKQGILVLGNYSLSQIQALDLKAAVSFEPFLIVNGKTTIKSGNGGWGMAPRTVIGQRKDGTVLMLVTEGRKLTMPGATLKDVQDIMLKYEAYNAANLDGGSSTTIYWDNKVLNDPSSMDGVRFIPTAFLIK